MNLDHHGGMTTNGGVIQTGGIMISGGINLNGGTIHPRRGGIIYQIGDIIHPGGIPLGVREQYTSQL